MFYEFVSIVILFIWNYCEHHLAVIEFKNKKETSFCGKQVAGHIDFRLFRVHSQRVARTNKQTIVLEIRHEEFVVL